MIAVGRASIFAHDKADLRDLDLAGVTGSPVGAIVAMNGEPEALVHLPAAYLDEILLRDRKSDAEDRLREMRTRIAEARSQLDLDPQSALGPINLFEHIENAEPFAQIETTLHPTFRTTTRCRPRRRLGYVLDAAFWAYWNWLLVESNFEQDLVRSLLENLELQLETYSTQGLSMLHAGEAVRHAMGAGASTRLRAEQGLERGETLVQKPSGNRRVAESIRALAADRKQANTLYRFVFQVVDAEFVQPLARYLRENDEMELRILSTLRLSDANLEELADVSTAVALARLHYGLSEPTRGARSALERAARAIRGDGETDLLNLEAKDPGVTWESIFSRLLSQHFTIAPATAAPEITVETQRGANAAILTVCAFPQLSRLIDLCLDDESTAVDGVNGPPTRDPFDHYDARVWWEIDLSSVETPRGLELDESATASRGTSSTAYSDKVLEGMRLAAAYDVDLVELANSIIAQVSDAHAQSSTGRVWFPADAIRALCCMEFLVVAEVSDPRLDEAFMRSALSPSEEATSKVSEIGRRVIEERGLTPVIDALLELIKDDSAPPASELL